MNNSNQKDSNPIRSSPVVIIAQLAAISFILSITFSVFEYFLLNLSIPASFHHHIIVGIFVVHLLKNLFLTYMDVMIILKWISTTYLLNGQRLIKRQGIFDTTEIVYDLRNLRSIAIHQGILGKLFHYGDLSIIASASGGYQDEIYLSGIANPEKYKNHLQQCIHLAEGKLRL